TPYTSFLVLESDADRERFGVKRRFRMRDGEKFFAEGRDKANFELKQQQMKRAGEWRQGLRRRVLAELNNLGRVLPASPQQYDMAPRYGWRAGVAGMPMGGTAGAWGRRAGDLDFDMPVSGAAEDRLGLLGDELLQDSKEAGRLFEPKFVEDTRTLSLVK